MPVWSRRCIGGGGIDAASLGVSGQLFGIHRYRSDSELGFATEQTRTKSRKAQIAIAVVIASVAGLFMCFLIMDLTQSSETSEHTGGWGAPPQTDSLSPINSSINAIGLWQEVLHSPITSQSMSNPPRAEIMANDHPMIELTSSNLHNHLDDNAPPQTTTILPTLLTRIQEVTKTVDLLKEADVVDETTSLPMTTEKKTGLKSARSLPEEKFLAGTGIILPESDGIRKGDRRKSEALPFTGLDAGITQRYDVQKRPGAPLPALDTKKWLEAVRAQYQIDKSAWPNRATDPTSNSRPFDHGTDTTQNQFLVVSNRGVVIPNSVQFPDLVKAATYPQLQTYRYPQTSRNIQDILRYVTASGNTNAVNRMRQTQWPAAVKKAAKVSGMYLAPNDNYASSTYMAGRPEAAFLAATTATTPQGAKPLNGHAYISDPFHPFKPADPTEINHLADNNPSYMDTDFSTNYVYPAKSTKMAQLRGQFGGSKQLQQTPYTTAIFKPFGNPDQVSTSTANVDTLMQYLPQQQKRIMPPLSVMLEIYPVSNEDSRTVPFRGTATSNAFRHPTTAMSSYQKEPPFRRPVALAIDASVASSHAVNVPIVPTSLQFQSHVQPQAVQPHVVHPQLVQPQTQPAFGMTLAGLPALPGMGPAESKHRMVVHLNFYPKKHTVPVVPRLRDPSEDLQTSLVGLADTVTAGIFSDYPRRRQSATNGVRKPTNEDNISPGHPAKENDLPGSSVVQAEFDASSLASILPKDVLQRFVEFLRSATPETEHPSNLEVTDDVPDGRGSEIPENREDHEVVDDQEVEDDSDEEDEDDDDEEGRIVPYPEELRRANLRRHPPMLRSPETVRVPFHRLWRSGGNVSWSDVQYDDENDDEEGIGEIKGRVLDDVLPKLKIMQGKTKVMAVTEDVSEDVKPTTTTQKPEADEYLTYKPRRRIVIEALPKNHRMQ